MKPAELILRCYGEKKGDVWQAFCLDLNLAAQGRTEKESREKLLSQMDSYLYDALEGEDKEYADQLLNRRAPIGNWIKYYYYKLVIGCDGAKKDFCRIFNESMPVKLAYHKA